MVIAGQKVDVGDHLYHLGQQAWGRIVRRDASGSYVFNLGGREMMTQDGGKIAGKRQLYWNEPIILDLPRTDTSSLRRILDVVIEEITAK